MDINVLRHHVAKGNFALRLHAIQHAVKEGFTKEHMIHVVMNGTVVETYPERKRLLFYADITIEGIKLPLHVVCEHKQSKDPVDFVTAYIPTQEDWETPFRRRKKK